MFFYGCFNFLFLDNKTTDVCCSGTYPRPPTPTKKTPHLSGAEEKSLEGMSLSTFHNTEYVYAVFFLQQICTLHTHTHSQLALSQL